MKKIRATRLLKNPGSKIININTEFRVQFHPFGNDNLKKMIYLMFKRSPRYDNIFSRDLLSDSDLLLPYDSILDFEELWLIRKLNLFGIERLKIRVMAPYTSDDITFIRTLKLGHFIDMIEKYWKHIGLNERQVAWIGYSMWEGMNYDNCSRFPIDRCGQYIDYVWNALDFRRKQAQASRGRMPEEWEFADFLVDFFRMLIYAPQKIHTDRKGKAWWYECCMDNDTIARMHILFNNISWNNGKEKPKLLETVHVSQSPIYLKKILETKKFEQVVCITRSRPIQKLKESLKRISELQWLIFHAFRFPMDQISVNTNKKTIYFIEDRFVEAAVKCCDFPKSVIIPLTGMSHDDYDEWE